MSAWLEWKLALRNLSRSPRRSLSTGLGIIVSYVGLTLLAGHIFNIEYAAKIPLIYGNSAGHVSIYKKGGLDNFDLQPLKYQLTSQDLVSISQMTEQIKDKIENQGAYLSAQALLSRGDRTIPILLRGVKPELDDYSRTHPRVKKHAPEFVALQSHESLGEAVRKYPDTVSISQGVFELLGFNKPLKELMEIDKQVVIAGRTLEGDLNAVNGTAILTHSTGTPFIEDTSVLTSLDVLRDLMQMDGASHVVLYLNHDEDTDFVVQNLRNQFAEMKLDFEAHPFTDDRIGLFYNGTMSFLYMMGSFFAFLILGASGLVIINSMTISLLERSQEIGTLMAIGFTPSRISNLFVKEAFWLALIASVFGCIVSEILAVLISSAGWTIESAGTTYSVLIKIMTKPWFHLLLTVFLILVSVAGTYWLVKRKTQEKVSSLLIDAGATT